MRTDILILGAGIGGLTLGAELAQKKIDFMIVEKEESPGGLIRTEKFAGVDCSAGVRYIHSDESEIANEYIREYLKLDAKEESIKIAGLLSDRLVGFPFQLNLKALPLSKRVRIFSELVRIQRGKKVKISKNYREWAYNKFGVTFSELFLIPHSEKSWRCFSDEIDYLGLSKKVILPNIGEMLKSCFFGIKSSHHKGRLHVEGGFQSIVDELVLSMPKEKIIHNTMVERIDLKKKKVLLSSETMKYDNAEIEYNHLVNTIPLPGFLKLASFVGLPDRIVTAAEMLRYNLMTSVLVKLQYPIVFPHHFLYVPNRNICFHRMSSPLKFINGSDETSILNVEVSWEKGFRKLLERSDYQMQLVQSVEDGLRRLGFMDINAIIAHRINFIHPCYILTDHNYLIAMERIHEYLGEQGVKLMGRFAEWNNLRIASTIERAIKISEQLGG